MKELPSHLKYAFLEPEGAKPVIISAALNKNEEQQLLRILRKYKEAIVWSIEDLKGISSSSLRRKRSSQSSFELSSSKKCLVAEKERENERK